MSVRIGHARQDENGGIDGAAGDQTGKEILVQDWYNRTGGWGVHLESIDAKMADRAATFMEQIAANGAFGYSQKTRWSGLEAIRANGGAVEGAAKSNFDCSSLCIACYILAGLDHAASGFTGSMASSMMATGKFRQYTDAAHLTSARLAVRGSLYIAPGKHVLMVLSDGAAAKDPVQDEEESIQRVLVVGGAVRVRTGGSILYPKLFTAKRGQSFRLIGRAKSGWYQIETDRGIGFITHKPRYTHLEEAHT